MSCAICEHAHRVEIEEQVLSLGFTSTPTPSTSPSDTPQNTPPQTLEAIAEQFNVSLRELQVHSVMHAARKFSPDNIAVDVAPSIVDELKFKEAVLMDALISEQMATMKLAGLKVRTHLSNETDGRTLSKEIVDTYLGTSNQVRGSIKELFEMNQRINGVEDNGTSALVEVVKAIRGSEQPSSGVKYTQFQGALSSSELAAEDD